MKTNEIAGVGNSLDYGLRMQDTRLARFKSIDPLTQKFPWYSPYQFAGNTPIQAIDLDGAEAYHFSRITDKSGNTVALKPIGAKDIYEWQWNPQRTSNGLGFTLWTRVKNPRKEFVVHQTDTKYMDNVYGLAQPYTYDESVTFDTYREAANSTDKNFMGIAADMEHYLLQGMNNNIHIDPFILNDPFKGLMVR